MGQPTNSQPQGFNPYQRQPYMGSNGFQFQPQYGGPSSWNPINVAQGYQGYSPKPFQNGTPYQGQPTYANGTTGGAQAGMQPMSGLPPQTQNPPTFGPTNPGGSWGVHGPAETPYGGTVGAFQGQGNSSSPTGPMQAGQQAWGWMGPNNYTPQFGAQQKAYIQKMLYGSGNTAPWASQVDPNNMIASIGQLSGVQFNPNDPMWKV